MRGMKTQPEPENQEFLQHIICERSYSCVHDSPDVMFGEVLSIRVQSLPTRLCTPSHIIGSRDPSTQIIPTLGPKDCKPFLRWAIWIPRESGFISQSSEEPVHISTLNPALSQPGLSRFHELQGFPIQLRGHEADRDLRRRH